LRGHSMAAVIALGLLSGLYSNSDLADVLPF
jgi:hypothetical protein